MRPPWRGGPFFSHAEFCQGFGGRLGRHGEPGALPLLLVERYEHAAEPQRYCDVYRVGSAEEVVSRHFDGAGSQGRIQRDQQQVRKLGYLAAHFREQLAAVQPGPPPIRQLFS